MAKKTQNGEFDTPQQTGSLDTQVTQNDGKEEDSETVSRRKFLQGGGLLAVGAALGTAIPFSDKIPSGLIPVALADGSLNLPGKKGLSLLNDKPINAETLPHMLDDEITPAEMMFVRNNGIVPDMSNVEVDNWQISIGGESCEKPTTFTVAELKSRFKHRTYQLVLECGGNGRSEYSPPASGNQWTTGAVACPEFTGVRLRDVLEACGIKKDAVYIGYHSADKHLSGDPKKEPISRGVPMEKALEDETLIAWAMNGSDLPLLNGYPLRFVCGGWPASVSGKWVKSIEIRNKKHDGAKMAAPSYSVPKYPVSPGTKVPKSDMVTIESMPVKSLITFPQTGISHAEGKTLSVRGHAWAGDLSVDMVEVSVDFGATWQKARLQRPANRLAWQHWKADLEFPSPGYYEIWAKATDSSGKSQPMVIPGWNPKGYLNNACHRIAVQIV